MKKILLLTLLAGAARAVDRFEHGDWVSACDNTNTCRAAGFQADGLGENPVALLLTRAAGAGAPLQGEISLAWADDGTEKPAPPLPTSVKLLLNGRSLGPVALDENGQGELTPAQLEALIDALQAKHADIRFSGGGTQWRLSDTGAAAVLLRLDAQQGRINSPSALMKKRRGSGPVTVSPLPVPVIRAAQVVPSEPSFIPAGSTDFQRLSRLLDPEEECLEFDDDENQPLTVHRLDDHFRLVSKLCNRGTHNESFRYGLFDSALQERQQLLGDEDPLNDYKDGTISGTHRMRSLGDCWAGASYVWTGERFMRSEVWDSGLCKGVGGGSWHLPTFVSEVKESD